MAIGPSGWTRTTTSRVKSPACCVDTTKGGVELIPGIEPRRRPYQGRRLPLHQISLERMAGFEPAPQGLEGPQATVTPHSHLVRPTGIEPAPPRWRRGMHSSTPRPNVDRCGSPAHRDPSVFKDPALASLVGGKGFEPRSLPGRTGLRPVNGPSRTTLPLLLHVSTVFRDRTSPRPGASLLPALGKNKKSPLGDRPRRPGSQ